MFSLRTKARVFARGMATAAPRIGDKKVSLSPLEPNNYVNYQRIEDTLAVVRQRCAYIPCSNYLVLMGDQA
jgi:aconitate hydratase